ncbi:hypothetical protein HHI36_005971, partial [Cryptolaemus montrouzieri]
EQHFHEGEVVFFVTGTDCRHREVLSVLLWCLLDDNLLAIIEELDVYVQAYADDIVIEAGGDYNDAIDVKMATDVNARVRELLNLELNKLNKKNIIDILVTKSVQDEVVSVPIGNFFPLFKNQQLVTNAETPLNHLNREIELLNGLKCQLQSRINDQCEITSLLKSNLKNSEVESANNIKPQ